MRELLSGNDPAGREHGVDTSLVVRESTCAPAKVEDQLRLVQEIS